MVVSIIFIEASHRRERNNKMTVEDIEEVEALERVYQSCKNAKDLNEKKVWVDVSDLIEVLRKHPKVLDNNIKKEWIQGEKHSRTEQKE
jgi:hypothetical protein